MIIGGAVEDVGKAVEGDTRAETVVVVGEAVEDVGVDTGTTVLNWKPLTMVEVGLEAVRAAVGCATTKDVGGVVAGVVTTTEGDAVGAGADTESSPPGI